MKYITVDGNDIGDVRVYTLSTCAWCHKLKAFLKKHGVQYRYIDLDTASEQGREEVIRYLDSLYDRWGFPTLLFEGKVLVCGYNEKNIIETLGLGEHQATESTEPLLEVHFSQEVEKTFEHIRRVNERKGYYLNPDEVFAKKLVTSLLENQARHGYWACPCRLASGIREEDKDIICPCIYREPDVAEYGACYCGLFVSEDVAQGRKRPAAVPERRPKKRVSPSRET